MNEGVAYRKRHSISKPPKHDFGIYSIKQYDDGDDEKEDAIVQNSTTAVRSYLSTSSSESSSSASSSATSSTTTTPIASKVPVDTIAGGCNNNNRVQMLLKERVRGISHKVDTMRLNDEEEQQQKQNNHLNNNFDGGTPTSLIVDVVDGVRAPGPPLNPDTKCATIPVTRRSKTVRTSRLITLEQSQQTQGDKLNQIKAMRRRPSRSANVITQW